MYSFHERTLSRQIKRMGSEFQLEFAALVFQSHSEIMLNNLGFLMESNWESSPNHRLAGAAILCLINLMFIWSLHNVTIFQDNRDSALISKFIHSLP